jgi:polysaccharide export outer membrane protein
LTFAARQKDRSSLPRLVIIGAACLASTACGVNSPLPSGRSAYGVIPYEPVGETAQYGDSYLLRPNDTIGVSVFLEPELSVENGQIDPAGNIILPLVGAVRAAGRSPEELASALEGALRRYVNEPKVAITVTPAERTIAVEGAVGRPGVYPVTNNVSLIEALALGGSPTRYADNNEIFVLRELNGRQAGARFDINRIRAGLDPDPIILPGDRIVVSGSQLKEGIRDYLDTPIFNIFRVF